MRAAYCKRDHRSYIVAAERAHHLARAIQLDFYALVEVLRSGLAHAVGRGRGAHAYLFQFWLCLRHVGDVFGQLFVKSSLS